MKHLWCLAIATAVAVACDKVPLTAPTGSTIRLTTNTNIVAINGTAEITATVIESAGTPVHNGTTVSFTTDFGRLDPPEARTVNGRATTTFIAGGQSGTVHINAVSGAASTTGAPASGDNPATPGSGVTLLVGGAAAGRLSARAEPATVPVSGGTVQIVAAVADTNGNPLAGAPVSFAIVTGAGLTGAGVLSSTTDVSDASGVARTSLTTSQTTSVSATVATALTTPVSATVTVTALATPTVTIISNTAAPVVGVPVSFTVTPPAAAGATPVQTVVVDFGDGTSQTLNGITGPFGLTHVYGRAGGYTVSATATDLNGQRGVSSIAIVVSRLQPTAAVTMTPAAPLAGQQVAFTVTATSATGGPPIASVVATADGVQVYSSSSGGSFFRSFPSGPHVVEVTVTDSAGSVGRSSIAFNVP